MANGLAPDAIKFLHDSATASFAPSLGSELQKIGLQSQVIATAFFVL